MDQLYRIASWTLLKFPRVSGLQFRLQGRFWFFLNGVAAQEFRKADFRVLMERTICPTACLKVSLAFNVLRYTGFLVEETDPLHQ